MTITEIVTSLTTAEKRHFTLYAGMNQKEIVPKYVQLFSLINNKPTINDEELIKAGFNAAVKNFLKEKSVTSKLKWLTESMERYFNKQRWIELSKCIKKAKKIAQQYERYLDWLQAIYWEKEMLTAQPESKNLLEKLEILIEEEQQVKENLLEEMNYFNSRAKLYALIIKDIRLNNPKNKEKFEQLISTDLLINDDNKPNSFKSKIDYYQIKARIAKYKGDKEDAYYMANKLFEIFINNPKYKSVYADRYKKSLCFISDICYFQLCLN